MHVTIKDIAKIAGVSHTTVSRALNNSTLIHAETKEKIQAIAEQLNYTPNYSAKSLVLHRSYMIGLFFSTLNTGTSASFFYDVVRQVNAVIQDQYHLIVKGIDDLENFTSIHKRNFDGIIVLSQSSKDKPFIEHVINKDVPLVILNRKVQDNKVINLLSDDYGGAFGATEYLIRHGHRHIAIIEGKEGFQSTRERKNGYVDALEKHQLELNKSHMVRGDYTMESGYQGMQQLLKVNPRPTALFCFNDEMAMGAMKAIQESGLAVPKDISLVGFDDHPFSAFLSPALTTVKRPIEKISYDGAIKLLNLLEGAETSPQADSIYEQTTMIERESVQSINMKGV